MKTQLSDDAFLLFWHVSAVPAGRDLAVRKSVRTDQLIRLLMLITLLAAGRQSRIVLNTTFCASHLALAVFKRMPNYVHGRMSACGFQCFEQAEYECTDLMRPKQHAP